MCSKILPCPLCCQPNFDSLDALRISLIKVANRPLLCPICNEVLLGLDKLTIHLFSHSVTIDQGDPVVTSDQLETKKGSVLESLKAVRKVKSSSTKNTVESIKCETITKSEDDKNNLIQIMIAPTLPVITPAATAASTLITSPGRNAIVPKCDICGFTFRNNNLLSMHLNLVHNSQSSVSALGDIIEPFNNSSTNNKFQCHLCHKYFKMKGSLRVHLRVVHMLGFQNKRLAQKINRNIALNEMRDEGNLIQNIYMIKNETEQIEQILEPCKIMIKSNDILLSPIAINASTAASGRTACSGSGMAESVDGGCIVNNKLQFDVSQINENKLTTTIEVAKTWECDICAKSFTTKYFLKKHKRLHTGEMPYSCTICGKTFTFQQSYHKHLLYHSDEKPHTCSTCGRAFKELSTLHNHERIHSGEKPFKCETCGKCFRQRVSYLVHRRIHTGAMPYKCTACAKSFRYKVSQRTHKCPAQPPGTVVRQSGDLLQKLLQNSSLISQNFPYISPSDLQKETTSSSDDFINHAIDEIVKESCNKMGIVEGTVFPPSSPVLTNVVDDIFGLHSNIQDINDTNLSSPSEQLQNLCLYSPSEESTVEGFSNNTLETINEDSFKQLLYGDGNTL